MLRIISLLLLSLSALAYGFEISGRIVGGKFAHENQFPYLISLRYFGDHNCGGAILNQKFILTAAHCVTYEDGSLLQPLRLLTIKAGTNFLEENPSAVVHDIKGIVVHELYGDDLNDLAIIELAAPLNFTLSVQPIQLDVNEPPSGGKVLVPGWGRTQNDGVISPYLKYSTMFAMTQSECHDQVKIIDAVEVICLQHSTKGTGACEGDSGGPAVYDGKLVGIGSYYLTECGGPFPDAYVRISHYIDWILEHSQI